MQDSFQVSYFIFLFPVSSTQAACCVTATCGGWGLGWFTISSNSLSLLFVLILPAFLEAMSCQSALKYLSAVSPNMQGCHRALKNLTPSLAFFIFKVKKRKECKFKEEEASNLLKRMSSITFSFMVYFTWTLTKGLISFPPFYILKILNLNNISSLKLCWYPDGIFWTW